MPQDMCITGIVCGPKNTDYNIKMCQFAFESESAYLVW